MYYKDAVFAAMSELRITVDELETVVPRRYLAVIRPTAICFSA